MESNEDNGNTKMGAVRSKSQKRKSAVTFVSCVSNLPTKINIINIIKENVVRGRGGKTRHKRKLGK